MNEIKKSKIKIKQLNNEIISLNKRLKKHKNFYSPLIIDKVISIKFKSKKNNKDKEKKEENNIKEYNDNARGINYNNFLLGNNKQKEKYIRINKNKSNKNDIKSSAKIYKANINKLNRNRMNINYNYINKIQKNVKNIVDIFHEQNDNLIPYDLYQINSASSKNKNKNQIKTRETSPSSIDKLKYSTIYQSNNKNRSQIIFKSNENIEKLKLYKKIKDYHKLFDKKMVEINKNIIPKSIRRTLSAFHHIRNSSPNFYDSYKNIYSNNIKSTNKNSDFNLKRKNKYKHLNISNSNNYNNNSANSNKKKQINYFRKKTPHKINTQKREVTPSLKINNNFFNMYYNSSSKNKMKFNGIDNSYHKKMQKSNISNVSNISAPNKNINLNSIIKEGNKIKNLRKNDKNLNTYKINLNNNIIDGMLNNVLIIANIKNKFELNSASHGVNKHSSFQKFK